MLFNQSDALSIIPPYKKQEAKDKEEAQDKEQGCFKIPFFHEVQTYRQAWRSPRQEGGQRRIPGADKSGQGCLKTIYCLVVSRLYMYSSTVTGSGRSRRFLSLRLLRCTLSLLMPRVLAIW